ncbi:MAG: DNA double-strand break repair nuclease NurA [Anaerolineales bacterium]|nr:DNA double-strand break repair nuclease NurA [Anaerolineales bacterium]
MPYSGELANKASHFDIVKNPDVEEFLNACDYLTIPSDEEGARIADRFRKVPPFPEMILPNSIIAFDGSRHESSILDRLPSTRVGYIKVSSVLIKLDEFDALKVGRHVDPFRVAKLQENSSSLTLTVPSANIRWQGKATVRDGFRAAVDAYFLGEKTRFKADDPRTSLRTTLFHLAHRRPGNIGTATAESLRVNRCPSCGAGPLGLRDVPEQQRCIHCQAEVYPTDSLRLWEEVADYQSNISAITRLMLVIEQLLPMHYIRYMVENGAIDSLAQTAFFMDGPLAIFGTPAWLHGSIMRYINEVNAQLATRKQKRLLIIGLQKTGQLVDHLQLIERFIEPGSIFPVDDEYRYQYIFAGRDPAGNGFGYETYYGQDFIYKTATGRTFVMALPYPFAHKRAATGIDFNQAKVDFRHYKELPRALALIDHFETDLYENAVVPIALANRYTAISLAPGGKVLDILTRQGLRD